MSLCALLRSLLCMYSVCQRTIVSVTVNRDSLGHRHTSALCSTYPVQCPLCSDLISHSILLPSGHSCSSVASSSQLDGVSHSGLQQPTRQQHHRRHARVLTPQETTDTSNPMVYSSVERVIMRRDIDRDEHASCRQCMNNRELLLSYNKGSRMRYHHDT